MCFFCVAIGADVHCSGSRIGNPAATGGSERAVGKMVSETQTLSQKRESSALVSPVQTTCVAARWSSTGSRLRTAAELPSKQCRLIIAIKPAQKRAGSGQKGHSGLAFTEKITLVKR